MQQQLNEVTRSDARGSHAARRRILIADDNELFAAGIAELLRAEDFAVRTVNRGGDVVPALDEELPDAVILDIGLPDMLGTEVSAEVVRRWPQMPIVLVSGHYGRNELADLLANRGVTFLPKPFTFDDLLSALRLVTGSGATSPAS